MRKALFTLVMVVLGLYLLLHLILGSSPVQRRVVDEIRRALQAYGLDLQIESIEFSAFTPKIYLNKVTLRSLHNAKINLPNPLEIDKIKIEFQPIALISKRLVIEDVTLFHPRLLIPNADLIYRRVTALLAKNRPVEIQGGGSFKVVLKKIGMVDALFNIVSSDPPFTVRSRSLSAYLVNNVSQQQNVTVSSHNLEVLRQGLYLNLSNVDVDVDATKRSIRVNRAVIESDTLSINVKGVSSLPTEKEKVPSSINASFDFKIPVSLLTKIPELKIPALDGVVASAGTISLTNKSYSGSGTLKYEGLSVAHYSIGRGALNYALNGQKLNLSEINLGYGGGQLASKGMAIELKDQYPVVGDLNLKSVRLEQILDSVRSPDSPFRFATNGPMDVHGTLMPLAINGDLKARFENLEIVNDGKQKKATADNLIISVKEGGIDAHLHFFQDRMEFQSQLQLLDGSLAGDGVVHFGNDAKVHAKGKGLSLTQLKHIADVSMGGRTNLNADIDFVSDHLKIVGDFDVTNGEISSIGIGNVKGKAHYENDLLSFENLEVPSTLEPVTGNGFVDFRPKHTHYRFSVDAPRLKLDEAFNSFHKLELSFPPPHKGDVSAHLAIEGGHDDQGIEVLATGQAKNFEWYDETWLTSTFSVLFRGNYTDINKLILYKKTGGLEIKAHVAQDGNRSSLEFLSHQLRLEEMDHLGKAPLTGELVGQVSFNGNLSAPSGAGALTLANTNFRGQALPDSTCRINSENGQFQIMANLFGEEMKGRIARTSPKNSSWNILLYFEKFDASPLVSVLMGKDLPTLNRINATGDISLEGDLSDWRTFKGSGSLASLEVGLKGTPMRNTRPINIEFNKGVVQVNRFSLIGKESEFTFELLYAPNRDSIRASLDGKLDLQFVQPFIPGLEYGSGKLSAGLRVSGRPKDFALLGNIALEGGSFQIAGIKDEFRNAQLQLSLSQDRINVDHFESTLNGGNVNVEGEVHIDKFHSLIPNLSITADRVVMRTGSYLTTRFSGDFTLKGNSAPYLLGGKCHILEANLTQFEVEATTRETRDPVIRFDLNCDAKEKLIVNTDVMNAEFRGNFHLLGDDNQIGLLGNAEAIQGSILFRERKFALNSGTVKFESADKILPRFNVSGRAVVKEATSLQNTQLQTAQEYEVNLQVYGIPTAYKLILTSTPNLAEADIISLLVLGVTSRGQDNNYMDLGSTLVGQIPFQSQLENQLGVDIKLNSQASSKVVNINPATTNNTSHVCVHPVPSVKIQKDITKRTKVSYSNTLEATPYRELKIEHMLDDNLTVNGTAVERAKGGTDATLTQSYGLDFRYRFQFE